MDDAVDVGVFLEDGVKGRFVGDVDLVVFRFLPADELYSVEGFGRGVVEVVNYNYFVARFEECEGCEGADVACTAGEM